MRRYCVYRMLDTEWKLLYVGSTSLPMSRVNHHRHTKWFRLVSHIELKWFTYEGDARKYEARTILEEKPRYNVVIPKSALASNVIRWSISVRLTGDFATLLKNDMFTFNVYRHIVEGVSGYHYAPPLQAQ